MMNCLHLNAVISLTYVDTHDAVTTTKKMNTPIPLKSPLLSLCHNSLPAPSQPQGTVYYRLVCIS